MPRRARRLGGVVLGGAICALGLLMACGPGFLDGLTGGTKANAEDTGTDGGGTESGPNDEGGAFVCAPSPLPERPTTEDSASDGPIELAFDSLRFANADHPNPVAPPPFGRNLDGKCTCAGPADKPEPVSCVPFDGGRPRDLTELCDYDGGRDNSLAKFFNELGKAVPLYSIELGTVLIQGGYFTLLVDIEGWNGKKDDPSVIVRVRGGQGHDQAATGRQAPLFDGTDVWTVDPQSIVGGDNIIGNDCRAGTICFGTVFDNNAYVRDNTLVANLRGSGSSETQIVLVAPEGPVKFRFYDGLLIAKISPITLDGGVNSYRLDGEITGRWPAKDFLHAIGNLGDPLLPGQPLCKNPDDTYGQMKNLVCQLLDLADAPALDNTGSACTNMSGALTFGAVPARAGHVGTIKPPNPDCGNWVDDCPR